MSAPYAIRPAWPSEPQPGADATTRLTWYASQARWAPSKHNSQPWRFLVTPSDLEIWADPSRLLAETDSHRRELVLSCGAAAHLAVVAARAHGIVAVVSVFPEGPGGCVARLVEKGPRSVTDLDRQLLDAVPRRRTDRGPLDADDLPASLAFELQDRATALGAELHLVSSPGDRSTVADLVARADRILVRSGRVDRELDQWVRPEGDARSDGVPSDHTRGAGASYRAEFVQRDFSTRDSHPGQDRAGVDHAMVAVLCTPTDEPSDHVRAGAALAAVLLLATVNGANASYLNQPVEHDPTRVQLRDQLGLAGVPQLVLRLGRGGVVTPPARRPQDDLVVHG